ncbi:MAG: hypothetical protein K6357_02725 [Elusimicrobiota bacterium]
MDKKIICGISACSSFLKIAISDGLNLSCFSEQILNFEDKMFEVIIKLLKKYGADFKDISDFCVVRGPGRFTGIRSVYSFVKVYQAISKCRVWGVDVFELLAYNLFLVDKRDVEIAVIIHAFKEEFYLAKYVIKNGSLIRKYDPGWLLFSDVCGKLKNFKGIALTDAEDYPQTVKMFKNLKFADQNLLKIDERNIINAAMFFGKKDISPFYLKPAKFEV